MALPTVTVNIFFADNWNATPNTYTYDVSAYVRSITVATGRSTELDDFQASTCSLILDNSDRRFDPENATPTYPAIRPNQQIEVLLNSTCIFRGLVDGWPQLYDQGNTDATVTLTATDYFKMLERLTLVGAATPATQTTGLRIDALMDDYVDLGDFLVLEGNGATTLANEAIPDGTTVLGLMKQVEVTEQGRLYCDHVGNNGKVLFIDRQNMVTRSRSTTSQATFSDQGTGIGYTSVTFNYDDRTLYNSVSVTPSTGTATTATNAASIAQYGTLTRTLSTLHQTNNEAEDVANFLVNKYKDPRLRADSLTYSIFADSPAALTTEVTTRRISDRITIERKPQNTKNLISKSVLVEGISYNITPSEIDVTYTCSPYDSLSYLVLDDATNGLLDTGRLYF